MKASDGHINLQYKTNLLQYTLFEQKKGQNRVKRGAFHNTFSSFFRNSLTCKQNFDTLSTPCTQGGGRVCTLSMHPASTPPTGYQFSGKTPLYIVSDFCKKWLKNAQYFALKMHFFCNYLICKQNFDTLYTECGEGVDRVWTPCVQYNSPSSSFSSSNFNLSFLRKKEKEKKRKRKKSCEI